MAGSQSRQLSWESTALGGRGPHLQAQARLGELAWAQVPVAKWVPMGKLPLASLMRRPAALSCGGLHGRGPR